MLIIRPSALGDVCRSVAVLASARRAWPGARIDWLVQRGYEDAIGAHPALTRVITFDRAAMRGGRWLWQAKGRRSLWALLGELRRTSYDLVLDCQGLLRSAVFARATGSRRRVGFADAREGGWLCLSERVRVPRAMHTVDRMLALFEACGVPAVRDLRLYASEADRAWASTRWANGDRVVVVAPGSRWTGKRWPSDRYAEVCARLLGDGLCDRVAVVGSGEERSDASATLALAEDPGLRARIIDCVGATNVGQLMALIERSSLVIANDSAALHMAVGFDRPLVGIFGPTRVDLVGPYAREADVIAEGTGLTRNRHKEPAVGREMMEAISMERVYEAAAVRLQRPGMHVRELDAAAPAGEIGSGR